MITRKKFSSPGAAAKERDYHPRRKPGGFTLRSSLYLPLCFLIYFLLDLSFRSIYGQFGATSLLDKIPLLFSFGWSLLLTAAAFLLPGIWKKIYMMLSILFFSLLVLTHGVMLNIFRRFFTFADFAFAGEANDFFDPSYFIIRKITILTALARVGLMVLAVRLIPRERRRRQRKKNLLSGLLVGVFGVAIIAGTSFFFLRSPDTVRWDNSSYDAAVYQSFSDTKKSLLLSGLYQYAFRDFYRTCFGGGLFKEAKEAKTVAALNTYFEEADPNPRKNEMTGVFAGKNLILIQLEAIDTWMLTEEVMPNLYRIRQESLDFVNHYAAVYITAGTFNTEFIANTGLIPPSSGVPITVYSENAFPYSLPRLFRNAGYSANSFHGSPGTVYGREAIHLNWGYERYHSGADLGMEDYTMDSQLLSGYDQMVSDSSLFDLIITYCGHGPYSMESSASAAHYAPMKKQSTRDEDVYIHALAHARETDLFIGALYDRLAAENRLDNTVLIFYSDHYNYYVMNDALVMQYKGVDNLNLLQHTPFFIYSKDRQPEKIDKVTSSADILPTIANLFGFEINPSYIAGHDAFGPEGGYVFFADGSWYDGTVYRDSSRPAENEYEKELDAKREQFFNSLPSNPALELFCQRAINSCLQRNRFPINDRAPFRRAVNLKLKFILLPAMPWLLRSPFAARQAGLPHTG